MLVGLATLTLLALGAISALAVLRPFRPYNSRPAALAGTIALLMLMMGVLKYAGPPPAPPRAPELQAVPARTALWSATRDTLACLTADATNAFLMAETLGAKGLTNPASNASRSGCVLVRKGQPVAPEGSAHDGIIRVWVGERGPLFMPDQHREPIR